MSIPLSSYFDVKSMIFNEKEHDKIINLLLKDRTTRNNIIWATDGYKERGKGFYPHEEIKKEHLDDGVIVPRAQKVRAEQKERTKDKAEVMTPSFIIKQMVEAVDNELQELPLIQYVRQDWMEITAGEAPYIVNRIDTVSGEHIAINERVGFLDKKLQRISKEIDDHDEWLWFVYRAYKASYGYEFQGDSLYLARLNLLHSFVDYYKDKFNEQPSNEYIIEVARIISYNVFQMDGLKYIIPLSDEVGEVFPNDVLAETGLIKKEVKEPVKVITKNWSKNQLFTFKEITEKEGGRNIMKFDVVIGNPPYQGIASNGNKNFSKPIYPEFIDSAYSVGEKVILITPGRFLFNAGGTKKAWNRKMLNDRHFKVIDFEMDSSKVFDNTDIKGGVAITYRDSTLQDNPIGLFVPHDELKRILSKVETTTPKKFLSDIAYGSGSYTLSKKLVDDYHNNNEIKSRGVGYGLKTNSFDKLSFLFTDTQPNDDYEYSEIYGRLNSQRVFKWIRSDYLNVPENHKKWKVFVPHSNGSGALGEGLSTPLIGAPLIGATQTFMSFGSFNYEGEANACMKYIKTKFARSLLGILKITQHNPPATWSKVPLQDFTQNSDIDWSKSISEIDQQLYKKYGLNEEEINFIETHVKEME